MSRSVPEWIADHDDQDIPARVRVRVFDRSEGRCVHCARKVGGGDRWQCDHIVPLILGGEHRESNMQALCEPCHKAKTRQDVAAKAKVARVKAKHIGAAKPKRPWHPTLRRKMSGEVVPRD